jgi:hypothetical protein
MRGSDCFAITGTLRQVDSHGIGLIIAGFDSVVNGMAISQTKTVTYPAAQTNGIQTSATNPLAGQDLTLIMTLLALNLQTNSPVNSPSTPLSTGP